MNWKHLIALGKDVTHCVGLTALVWGVSVSEDKLRPFMTRAINEQINKWANKWMGKRDKPALPFVKINNGFMLVKTLWCSLMNALIFSYFIQSEGIKT